MKKMPLPKPLKDGETIASRVEINKKSSQGVSSSDPWTCELCGGVNNSRKDTCYWCKSTGWKVDNGDSW
jgi:hypothetical protein